MKKIALSLITAAAAAFSTASASDLTVTVTNDYVTEYIFRGVELADASVQPGIEFGYGDATFGIWSSFATNNDDNGVAGSTVADSQNEFDIYGSYNFGLSDIVNVDLGWTLYYYPNTSAPIDGNDYSNEPFAQFNFDTLLAPSVLLAYDIDLESFTIQGSIGHSFDLPYENTTLDLGAHVGNVELDVGEDYIYYGANAGINYQMTEHGSFGIGLAYDNNDADLAADSNLTASVSVSASF
jgi:uncharacterized protein (TIGR02001 family)